MSNEIVKDIKAFLDGLMKPKPKQPLTAEEDENGVVVVREGENGPIRYMMCRADWDDIVKYKPEKENE